MARPQNNNGAGAVVPVLPAQNDDAGFDEVEGHFGEMIRDGNGNPLIVEGDNIVPRVDPNPQVVVRNLDRQNAGGGISR